MPASGAAARRRTPRGTIGLVPTDDFRSAAEHGLMAGAAPYPDERRVTLANWQDPPFSRWGFQHIADLIPTARIRRGDGPVWSLPRAERDLGAVLLPFGDRRVNLDTFRQGGKLHTWDVCTARAGLRLARIGVISEMDSAKSVHFIHVAYGPHGLWALRGPPRAVQAWGV